MRPMLEKMSQVKEQSQALGEFLDWLGLITNRSKGSA